MVVQTFPDWKGKLPTAIYDQLFDADGNMLENGWAGTDWIDESYHEGAMTTNHSISMVGGTDVSKFNLGFAYTKQDGILGGETQSQFDRYNFRINSSHAILTSKNKKYNVITIGENLNVNRHMRRGISQSNIVLEQRTRPLER